MSAPEHYWQFHQLNGRGEVRSKEILSAKDFIREQCADIVKKVPFSDAAMEQRLFALMNRDNLTAEICLRCYISSQIRQVCLKLAQQFGESHQFNAYDLFSLVLDDVLELTRQSQITEYKSMARKILSTFDPQKARLSTWITRLVRSEANLNQFLLEKGLYLISNWAILNDTNPQQLQRIFREFHNLNEGAITQATSLLTAYHTVYRQERLASRMTGNRSKCLDPTATQLQKMAEILGITANSEILLDRLISLAEKLREYRIFVKGGKPKQDSWDNPDIQMKVEKQQIDNTADDGEQNLQGEFLTRYRQQFTSCLETAITSVIFQWQSQQKEPKKQQFLRALKLFHCQGLSMTAIATEIGLQAQYQVTRLLKLKDLRSDIQQKMLQELRQQIVVLAATYTDPEQLIKQENQIEIALSEQVNSVISQAESEASTAKNQPLTSILAQYICRYLDSQEN
jgi:hypothetical protein